MFSYILKKIFGSQIERELKKIRPLVEQINSLESTISSLSDAQLRAKTDAFRAQLAEGKTLDDLLPEAFAVVREASKRILHMRHYDAQLIGGVVLHRGKIAEMATGEGKTLVATLPVYLNALTGQGVHVVTVNDYLAKRDYEWMGPIYTFLGLTVGVIQHDMPPAQRQKAYACDITYGTNNEYGFDYLRDNMVVSKEEMVQRPHHYGIVDEVDSILIDEARTPLIISGPADESTDLYYRIDKIIPQLVRGQRNEKTKEETEDFVMDEKSRTVNLTEKGELKAASLLGIPNLHDISAIEYRHHIIQALVAHHLYARDVDYMIKDGEIVIVDEFTGRLMPGRRWSDGLHQAVEAKEKVEIKRENQTLATITFQNYFRMYKKLGGMTGTALTEADEFYHIYKLEVVSIPTNKPLIRMNYNDVIYRTEKEKFNAIIEEIIELYKKGRPVLVGTISIAKSEHLSALLKKRGITHQVLNAKYHEQEASIVAQAGRFQGVTIATNMAGRGTDILLGGNAEAFTKDYFKKKNISPEQINPEEWNKVFDQVKVKVTEEHEKVVALGGLHVIGTERHESRRIDNQLRGRSGRQGDPGSSRFYVSLQDDLMRIFGSDRISAMMERLGMEEGTPIENRLVTHAIETAQKRVEARNFDIRKHLLEYDNVMNKQREIVYKERRRILEGRDLKGLFFEILEDVVWERIEGAGGKGIASGQWDYEGFSQWVYHTFGIDIAHKELQEANSADEVYDLVFPLVQNVYTRKEESSDPEIMRYLEKRIMLQLFDAKWKDHLYAMDHLREGIHLRAYGQRDPLVEYTNEGFTLFNDMFSSLKEEIVSLLFKIKTEVVETPQQGVFSRIRQNFVHQDAGQFAGEDMHPHASDEMPLPAYGDREHHAQPPVQRALPKVGRNDPCPCGSGKKYKKCCGQ